MKNYIVAALGAIWLASILYVGLYAQAPTTTTTPTPKAATLSCTDELAYYKARVAQLNAINRQQLEFNQALQAIVGGQLRGENAGVQAAEAALKKACEEPTAPTLPGAFGMTDAGPTCTPKPVAPAPTPTPQPPTKAK